MTKSFIKTNSIGTFYYKDEGLTLFHREDGPAVEYYNGCKVWYVNGKRHRIDGPTIEWINGDKHWYLNGEYHREDGPAVEYADGTKHWYFNGKQYSESEFYIAIGRKNLILFI